MHRVSAAEVPAHHGEQLVHWRPRGPSVFDLGRGRLEPLERVMVIYHEVGELLDDVAIEDAANSFEALGSTVNRKEWRQSKGDHLAELLQVSR